MLIILVISKEVIVNRINIPVTGKILSDLKNKIQLCYKRYISNVRAQ
jgi:hypothetical protein